MAAIAPLLMMGAGLGTAGALGAGTLSTAMLAATGLSAGGSIMGGLQQQEAGQYNEAVDEQKAEQVNAEGAAEQTQQKIQNEERMGVATANAGGSGVDTGTGSPVDALSTIAQQGELSEQLLGYRATVQSNAYRQAGQLATYQGNQALMKGVVGAGVSTLLGYSNVTNPESPYFIGGGAPSSRGDFLSNSTA